MRWAVVNNLAAVEGSITNSKITPTAIAFMDRRDDNFELSNS